MKNFRFLILISLLSTFTLIANAQITYVVPDVALERLEVKAQEVEELITAGEIKGVDADIRQAVFKILSNDLRQNNEVEICIQAAFDKCYEMYQESTKEVDEVKEMIINLFNDTNML